MDSKLRKMGILASMAVILLVALAVMYVNREQLSPTSGQNTEVSGAQNAGDGEAVDPVPEGTGETDTAEADGRIGNDLKAFLKDNTFFDPDVNPILEAAKDNSHRLSLVATSVEKDLRIQIVDNEGVPVTGESFYVRVDGLGDYKDLDQDGVIYIADLDSGDYYMELLPIEGYKVPITETKVHVKEKVEYLAIDDISLLIKTEDEVDADAEDSAVAGALADADKTEIQKLQTTSGNAKVGIDVSKWNGTIDWDKVKNAGVQFAIVRAGYRGSVTGSLVEDPQFVANCSITLADYPCNSPRQRSHNRFWHLWIIPCRKTEDTGTMTWRIFRREEPMRQLFVPWDWKRLQLPGPETVRAAASEALAIRDLIQDPRQP